MMSSSGIHQANIPITAITGLVNAYTPRRFYKGDYIIQKVLSYQNSGKADDAQIKIRLCYLKMGQTGAAKDEFRN